MNKKHRVHFVGICGPTVGSIALLLKKNGWKITGSDRDIYPPASDFLRDNKVSILEGFDASRINDDIDMVILGGGAMIMDKHNPEVVKARKLGIKTMSWPSFVSKYLIKKESVVVAGTYGKTTTTAMVAWVLKNAGKDPSYLIGGYANNFPINVELGKSLYSVVEGDEHPSALNFDNKSKFLYYKPKHVLITSAKWDHFNIFPKEKDYISVFKELVKLIPESGTLVLCKNGENLEKLASIAKCKVVWYSVDSFQGKLDVIGKFNRENAAGAATLCRLLGITDGLINSSLSTFNGVKRRLEKKGETKDVILIEDFAQHPFKVKEVLNTLKKEYPKRKLVLVFDPFASILRNKSSLPFYKNNFKKASLML